MTGHWILVAVILYKHIYLDRIYRIIRIILFWYSYIQSILLILSEK